MPAPPSSLCAPLRYEVQFIGHSLGGGVAALAACICNWDVRAAAALGGARCTAATFAAPPGVCGIGGGESDGWLGGASQWPPPRAQPGEAPAWAACTAVDM